MWTRVLTPAAGGGMRIRNNILDGGGHACRRFGIYELDSSGGANRTRAFDFNVFAADLFRSLTVRKSSSADVDEGSLGATIERLP